MGTWGSDPWDNDEAAGWFASLFEQTSLADCVEECLRRDISTNMAEIRAAASVVVMLGRVYIWPLDSLDRCLPLAIDRLREIKVRLERLDDEDFRGRINAIAADIKTLQSRQNSNTGS